MKYVAALLNDQTYIQKLHQIEVYEQDRIYCRHGFSHLMDVARLSWQYAMERRLKADKEQLYLAALLHDIGRADEYQYGISHEAAGKRLAGEILLHIGYPEEKTAEILAAIEGHRGEADRGEDKTAGLAELIKEADHLSRPCFFCQAADSCKWSSERKNRKENWR